MKVAQEVAAIVEAVCRRETNAFGYDIWTHHILQVVKNGKRLAPLFNADPEIVELAALLHDYASVKDEALYKEHHLHSAAEAERVLRRLGYPPDRIKSIQHCIETHRGSVLRERHSPEAECLANADALTHLEQVPGLLYLAYMRRGMGIDEGAQWVREKLSRSWRKLAPQVQVLAREQYEAALKSLTVSDPA